MFDFENLDVYRKAEESFSFNFSKLFFNVCKTKAKAAKLTSDLRQIEKALAGWGIVDENITEW